MAKIVPDQEKIQRFKAFWSRAETDRPLLGTTISTFPSVGSIHGEGIMRPENLDLEANIKELDEERALWSQVSGDSVWVANPLWAFPWHLAIAGSPIDRDGENLWGLPCINSWDDLKKMKFDPNNEFFQTFARFIKALVEHFDGEVPIGVGHLGLGPIDSMMQMRGQEQIATDLYDAPDKVREMCMLSVKLIGDITSAAYDLVPRWNGGYGGLIRYFWAPDRTVETGEDMSFMTSPEMHRQIIAPMHKALGQRFPYQLVHVHSAQMHTIPNLLDLEGVAAIEITPDYGEDMLPHIPLMRRILEKKPLLVHGIMSTESVKEMTRQLPHRGLALFVRCDTPQIAEQVLEEIL